MNRILFYALLALATGFSVAGIIISARDDDAALSAGLWAGAIASVLILSYKHWSHIWRNVYASDNYIGLFFAGAALLIAGITLSSVKHVSEDAGDGPSVGTISGVWGGCDLAFVAYFMLHWYHG